MLILEHLDTILISIIIGFTGSRIAVMLFDFMCYGGILWKVKYMIAYKLGFNMPDVSDYGISEGYQKLQEHYDFISTKSFIIGLLDCKYCMTVWTCAIIALIGILGYGVSWICLMYGILFGYLITEKV